MEPGVPLQDDAAVYFIKMAEAMILDVSGQRSGRLLVPMK